MTWYHGSNVELASLRVGSSVTEDRNLARAFSHQPTLLGRSDGSVRHNGTEPGFLYEVAETLSDSDLEKHPHPANEDGWEWLTTREVAVTLLERTQPRPEELFSDDEIARIRAKQRELNVRTFVSDERLY
jgi:hypothetical protein